MAMTNDVAVLHFKKHNFQATCYNAIGCTVRYNHHNQIEDPPERVSPPPVGADYREAWGSVEVGIPNFPGPAIVQWKSMDGMQHEAKIDIGAIFRDQRVVHRVPVHEVPEQWLHQDLMPDIYLEINDKSIQVFMQAHVPTKHLQDASRPLSDFRDDLIEVWSKTY